VQTDVVVIGAGQAGLSSAYFLRRAGFAPGDGYVVLDAAAGPGGAWQYRWPTLLLGAVHGIYGLPGMSLTAADPTKPAADVVPGYFANYEKRFELPVHRPVRVHAVHRGPGDRLLVDSDEGEYAAKAVINASGTWGNPFWPHYPGRETFTGRQLHTADYRGPAEFAGKRVVVVGGGTSAVQLLTEISRVAATTWVTRRPPVFRDEPFTPELGRAAVALVEDAVRAGRPPASVVSVTGLSRTPAVREAEARGALHRRPMFQRITPQGVRWADGTALDADVILWCTGWRADLGHLAPLHLRAPGGGIVMDGTRVVAEPRLHLVGYGPSASTIGANRAGRFAVRDIRALLGRPAAA
jgi:cation diffusion facilitator CzcD-associated flavoprotein CzcO